MAKAICSVDGCEKPVKARTYCESHYARAWRYGDPEYHRPRPEPYGCAVEGCDRAAKKRGWCIRHYKRWERHGDPTAGRVYESDAYAAGGSRSSAGGAQRITPAGASTAMPTGPRHRFLAVAAAFRAEHMPFAVLR
jgi:hypothetical protein